MIWRVGGQYPSLINTAFNDEVQWGETLNYRMIQQLSDRCRRDNVCGSDVKSYALATLIEISAVMRTFEYSTGSEHKVCKASALDMVPS
jgi:hypothetical protein